MKSYQEILTSLNENKAYLFSKYPLKSIAIFGSVSREEHHSESDLDVLVEFKDKIGIRFIDLAIELEKIVGTKIDLVSKNGIKKKYFDHISQDLKYV